MNPVDEYFEIFALPVLGTNGQEDPLNRLPDNLEKSKKHRILALHGQVDSVIGLAGRGADHKSDEISFKKLQTLTDSGLFDYVALGDRHSTTDVTDIDAEFTERTGRIFYSGAPEPTDFDEKNQRNILVVDVGGSIPKVEAVRVGDWTFERVGSPQRPVKIHSRDDLDRFIEVWSKREDEKTAVKLYLQKYYALADDIHRATVFDEFNENRFAHFREAKSSLEFTPKNDFSPGDENPLKLNGYLLETYSELLTKARSDDAVARRALETLTRLANSK